jgi:hypothetical protein
LHKISCTLKKTISKWSEFFHEISYKDLFCSPPHNLKQGA